MARCLYNGAHANICNEFHYIAEKVVRRTSRTGSYAYVKLKVIVKPWLLSHYKIYPWGGHLYHNSSEVVLCLGLCSLA